MKLQWPEGLDEARFLNEYWQQKPLLIRSAFKDFHNPIDPNELAGLSCEEDANSRFMQHTGNNEWRLCEGPLSDDFFDDVTGNEWSLLVSDIEKLLPDFRQYLEPFRFLPDWRIDDLMISYAPVGGSVGAHVDQYDVFLLQADGVREWRIENTPRQGVQPSVSNTIALLGDFLADETWQLQAGDMLYLPPQFAHHGIAVDEPCMTWSIGFRAPSIDEMLPEVVNYLLESVQSKQRFQDIKRPATHQPGLISQTDLIAIKAILSQALTQDDSTLSQWIARYLTEPKEIQEPDEQPVNTISTDAIVSNLKNSAVLTCHSHKRFAYTQQDNHTTLYADGQAYDCSEILASAICNQRSVGISDIDKNSHDLDLLATLFNKHIVLFEDHE